jgi:hypothetical protein
MRLWRLERNAGVLRCAQNDPTSLLPEVVLDGCEKRRPENVLCGLLLVGWLFDGVAGCVDELDWGEVQLFECWLDFGSVAYFDDDEVIGVDIGFCYAFDVLWSDGEVRRGQCCIVVERTFVEEDGGHCICGGVRGFELARE